MNIYEKLQIESELQFLQQRLSDLPSTARLTRRSLESRIKELDSLISQTPTFTNPARAILTFRGRPVVNSSGIFADFGLRATDKFTTAVSTVAASLLGPVASSGRLPNRDRCQLLITSTAVGSFGFAMEEHRSGILPIEMETNASDALKVTQEILEASAHGTDDELADTVSEANSRAVESLRDFVELLATNEATCALEVADRSFRFADIGEVHHSAERLSNKNVKEDDVRLYGEFQGVLPKERSFEFLLASTNEVVRGKISKEVTDPDMINRHLHQRTSISVRETKIGDGKPKYKLLSIPGWPGSPSAEPTGQPDEKH